MDSHLLRFNLTNQKYIIWDLETENLNLMQKNRPWQCSFIVCHGKRTIESFDLFPFWKDINVGVEAARITRFNKQVYSAKSTDALEALKTFETYLYDPEYLNVGHNILGFDVYVHNIWRKELGLKSDYSYLSRSIDTNSVAKGMRFISAPKNAEDRLFWMYRMNHTFKKGTKTSIKALAKEFGIEYDENSAHDGIVDVGYNKEIFLQLINQVEI